VESPGASRAELAERLGVKPDSLSRPLKKLVDRGLVERGGRGSYRPAEDWPQVLERERLLGGERLAENLDRAQYEREREAYRRRLVERGSQGPRSLLPGLQHEEGQ
jgi:DNA-binding transcriptional ArsR family regulator